MSKKGERFAPRRPALDTIKYAIMGTRMICGEKDSSST
jgi:hypothetical protein